MTQLCHRRCPVTCLFVVALAAVALGKMRVMVILRSACGQQGLQLFPMVIWWNNGFGPGDALGRAVSVVCPESSRSLNHCVGFL